jgi:hypothetical protein
MAAGDSLTGLGINPVSSGTAPNVTVTNNSVGSCLTTGVAQLTRFAVEIGANCYTSATAGGVNALVGNLDKTYKLFSNCIKVTGLTMGEEGTIEVPQWGITGMMADGQRKLSPISMDFRIQDGVSAETDTSLTALIFNMFENRGNAKYNINIYITNRAFQTLFVYNYIGCDMRSLKIEDQELGSPKLGTLTAEFLPLNVAVKSCNNTKTLVNTRSAANSGAFSC